MNSIHKLSEQGTLAKPAGAYWFFSIMIVAFASLAIYNFVSYFWKKILVLKQNKFHMLMFALIETSLIALVIWSSLWIVIYRQTIDGLLKGSEAQGFWNAAVVSFYIYWSCNIFAHCIFVIKYWLVSQKIAQHFNSSNQNVERQAIIWLSFLITWVSFVTVANVYHLWDLDLEISLFFKLATALTLIAPLACFAILAHALWKLRAFKEHF